MFSINKDLGLIFAEKPFREVGRFSLDAALLFECHVAQVVFEFL